MKVLREPGDLTPAIYATVSECVEDWFSDEPLHEERFIDRLCDDYLNPQGYDIESLGARAVASIMRTARRTKRELA